MSYDPENIFALMVKGKIPCKKIYEDENTLAFHDLHPAAPVHILVIPKNEYCSFDDFVDKAEAEEVAKFFKKVKDIANDAGLGKSGYRIIMNHGDDASQTIKHLHVHILGKKKLGPLVVGDAYHQ